MDNTAYTIICICFCAVSLFVVWGAFLISSDKFYPRFVWLWNRKAYKAWKKAYNGKMYAMPNQCDSYEHFVGFGVEWWGYVHVEDSPLICLLYKNKIERDDKIRVAIFNTESGNGVFDKDNLLFTHYWEHHGDKLVEKALPLILENYHDSETGKNK